MKSPIGEVATAALETLQGARKLPYDLQRKGVADNDAWQHAIETMVSLANEAD